MKKLKKDQWLIGALAGILLLVIAVPVPKEEKKEETLTDTAKSEPVFVEMTIEEQLKEILQKVSGVGKVEVFINYEDRGKIVVGKDESLSEEVIEETDSNGGKRTTATARKEHQTVYGSEKNPYVVQEFSPEVKGILVVAEGAGNVSIKNKIQETIEALFGLDAHKISIMKMEVSQ
jgi:stage III sporulation protein AG